MNRIGVALGALGVGGAVGTWALGRSLRGDGDNYTCETGLSALSDVIGTPKRLPKEWINEDGVSLNFQFFRYATPLIQGEVAVPYDNGLPAYAKLAKESVDKTLPAYEG